MDQLVGVLLCVLGIALYFFVQRQREPGYALEVAIALRRSAELARAHGNESRAKELDRLANSIQEALSCLAAKRPLPEADESRVIRDIFHASSAEILNAAEIFEINGRRGNCYSALMNLTSRVRKL